MSRGASQTEQIDLFANHVAPPAYVPKPEHVRNRLNKVFAEMRASETYPWSPATVTLYRRIMPGMTQHLPDEEAVRWREDFSREFARLDATPPT